MKIVQVGGIGRLERYAVAPDAGDQRSRWRLRSPPVSLPGERQVDGGLDLPALDAKAALA